MNRKQFLKLTSLSSLGLVLQPIMNFANPFVIESFDENVIFYTNKDLEYDSLRAGFNSRINKFPAVIALCYNTKGVQEAVLYANKLNLPISIKSGGHSMEGFSCGNKGMQIIVSNLNTIDWINSYKIKVGPGVLLKNLYDEILPKNRILPGGSCAMVAIGGLSLGGGYGLISKLFGLTCDSLEEVKIVDGNGNIISSNTDKDLLWACKGGGNGNFGVITEMVFKVHNRPTFMSSYRFRTAKINLEKGKEILKNWFEESEKLPKSCFSTCLFNGDSIYILLTNVSKPTPEIQEFLIKMKSLTDKLSYNVQQPLAKALKNYYGKQHPLLFKNASSGLYKSFDEIEPMIDSILAIVFKTKGMIYQFNTLGGAIQNPTFEKSSSFPHREYSFFTELQTYWESPNEEGKLLKRFEEVQEIVANHGVSAQYANYPDINFANFEKLYYSKNLSKLKELKKRYDPQNNINHEQSIKS